MQIFGENFCQKSTPYVTIIYARGEYSHHEKSARYAGAKGYRFGQII